MKKYDVIIVGAGPAGSFAALKLAAEGFSVLQIDRKERPGTPKECAEGVGEQIFDLIGLPVRPEWISNRFDSASVSFTGCGKITFKTSNTKGCVLNRKVFDHDLAMEAGRAGAELMLGKAVVDVSITDTAVVKTSDGASYSSKLLIAGDGPQSQVAGRLGLGKTTCGFGFQYELEGPITPSNALQFIFDPAATGFDGYYWIFPKKDSINIGVGSIACRDLKRQLDLFVKERGLSGRRVLEQNAGLIPAESHIKHIYADRLVITGDAAGHTNPFTGGGIAAALYDGFMAAKVASEAIKADDCRARQLSKYGSAWQKSAFRRSWKAGLKLKQIFDDPKNLKELASAFRKLDGEIVTGRKDLGRLARKGLSLRELYLLYASGRNFSLIIP